jgi:hypothetical protein
MRFDPVFGALANVSNRYLLTMVAAKAVRKFHRPNTRIQETANEVLVRFSRAIPMGRPQCIWQPRVQALRQASSYRLYRPEIPRSRFMYPLWARFLPISWPQKRENTTSGSFDGC